MTQHYPPEVAATGQLLAELAEDLAERDFLPTVLAGKPSYGPSEQHARVPRRERRNGVEIIRTFSTRFSRTSRFGRAANWISYPVASLIRGLARIDRPDVVVGYSAPPTVTPVAYLLAKRWRARFVLYTQDLYPDVAWAVGALQNRPMFKIWRSMNRFMYKRADAIVTLGDHMAAHISREGVPLERVAVVHNWADGKQVYPISNQEIPLKQTTELVNRFVVLYSGNLGMAHDIRPICEALSLLKSHRERLAFLFVGGGVRWRDMESFVEREGLGDFVYFREYVVKDALLTSLNVADATLLTVLGGTEGLVVPSKLYGYMAVGRPVLAICPNPCEISDIIDATECGLVAKTGKELADAVLLLLNNSGLSAEMGERARAVFEEQFERRKATARIGEILRSVS